MPANLRDNAIDPPSGGSTSIRMLLGNARQWILIRVPAVMRAHRGRRTLRKLANCDDRTLRDDEVNDIQRRVARRIEEAFGLTWRSA